MTTRFLAFMALSLTTVTAVHGQADRSLVSSRSSYAIPGTSAVGFRSPATMQSQPTTLSPTTLSINPSIAPLTAADNYSRDSRSLEKDTTSVVTKIKQEAQDNAHNYPAALDDYYYYGGLHPGLNLSLGMSVFAQFGKNARKGAGFTQSLTATYLQPLGRKAWMAVGGYVDHTNWSGDSYTTGGLYGELGYQFNDHWSAYIYGQKSIVSSGLRAYDYPYGSGLYGMGSPYLYNNLGDKLGAAVRWTPNRTFSMEVSVEKNWYPNSRFGYSDDRKYNYPSPQK